MTDKRYYLTVALLAFLVMGAVAINVLAAVIPLQFRGLQYTGLGHLYLPLGVPTPMDKFTAALGYALLFGGWCVFHWTTRHLRKMVW